MIRASILIHGVVATLALVGLLVALALPKRRGAHPWAGRVALGCLGLAIVLAGPAIWARANLFLLGVGWIVVTHGVVAWWAAATRPRARLEGLARWGVVVGALGYAGLLALGVIRTVEGQGLGPVAIGLSMPGWALAVVLWRYDGTRGWLALHVHGAAGASIAGITAFAAVVVPRYLPGLPPWVVWLAPSVLLTPAFILAGRRVRRR